MKEIKLMDVINVINKSENLKLSASQSEDNLSELGMDSITFIQIIVGLEEAFDCEIPDSKLLITEMDTVQKMFEVLREICET